jgi:hypothetical protein
MRVSNVVSTLSAQTCSIFSGRQLEVWAARTTEFSSAWFGVRSTELQPPTGCKQRKRHRVMGAVLSHHHPAGAEPPPQIAVDDPPMPC